MKLSRKLNDSLLALCLALAPSHGLAADAEDALQDRLNSVNDTQLTPAPPLKDDKAESTGAFETNDDYVGYGEGSYNLFWKDGHKWVTLPIAATYGIARYQYNRRAARARADFQRQIEQWKATFPEGAKKLPSVRETPGFKAAIERLETAENRLGARIAEIENPALRRAALTTFGSEVCDRYLGRLSKGREALRRTGQRWNRWWRGGASSANRPVIHVEGEGTAEDILKAMESDARDMHDAYSDFYREAEAVRDTVESLSGRKLKLPPTPDKLITTPAWGTAEIADHRAIRDGMNDLVQYIDSHIEKVSEGANRRTLREEISTSVHDLYENMKWSGQPFRTLGRGALAVGSSAIHPFRTTGRAFTGALAGAKRFSPEIISFVALLVANGMLEGRMAAALAQQHSSQDRAAEEAREEERRLYDDTLEAQQNEQTLLILTAVWKVAVSKQLAPYARTAFPYLTKDEKGNWVADHSPAALQSLGNLKAEAAADSRALGVTDMEALWIKLFKEMDKLNSEKAIWKKHSGTIKLLAETSGQFAVDGIPVLEEYSDALKEESTEAAATAK